ncbi:MAG: acetate/propionate family kinase [Acidimicrobiales bacterium]|nr:acetate/propionate family kinase [Acidimicrobiales bacterium]
MSLVLVVNAGSSSLKLSVLDSGDEVVAASEAEDWDGNDVSVLARVVEQAGPLDAVGHRVVHGGPDLRGPVVIDAETETAIEALTPLAPLHQPRALAGIRAADRLLPDVPAVACFDTAFHATLPAAEATYALPLAWRRLGVRRYGFHGLSHEWASRRAGELLGRPVEELRLVTAHLGAGASLCAVGGGKSVATTMGFTPLDGLVMATRAGSIDPGVLLWLQQEHGLSASEIESALEHQSGLLALFGSGDMRDVEAALARDDDAAGLAYGVYLHRLRSSVAAMAASLGGLDALVFTGGVGEHSARVRVDTCSGLAFLGLAVDSTANDAAVPDANVGDADAPAATLVVASREDRQIAGETRRVLAE